MDTKMGEKLWKFKYFCLTLHHNSYESNILNCKIMNLQIRSEEGYSGHLTMPDDSKEFVEDYVLSKLPFLERQTFYITIS